jgi:hypothetical protein
VSYQRYHWEGYNPPNRSGYNYCPALPTIDWAYWVTKALANISPNRAVVNLPLMIYELKDAPRMVGSIGKMLLKREKNGGKISAKGWQEIKDDFQAAEGQQIPDQFLSWSFGWAPLISDLEGLLNFAKSWEDRMDYLRKVQKGVKVQRNLKRHSFKEAQAPYSIANSGLVLLREKQWDVSYWYTARIKPKSEDLPTDGLSGELYSLLNILGVDSPTKLLWDSIPWSWLIDYFGNIGDFLEAGNGLLSYDVTDMNVMAYIKERDVLVGELLNPYQITWSGGTLTTESKFRHIEATPRPRFARRPMLSGSQRANLGALTVSKLVKTLTSKRR